jgi:glycosyltransferase involved in cell wall biosynthesis
MKLVIATPLYPPEPGGPATYAKTLEDELPKRAGGEWEVEVVKFSAVRRYPRGIRHLVYFWHVFRRARRADIVMAQDTFSCGIPSLCAARLSRTPIIVRVPGDYAWEQGRERWGVTDDLDAFQQRRAAWQVELLRALQSWVVRSADAALVPSAYFASVVRQWGVAPDRIRVIYHGIALPLAAEKPDSRPEGRIIASAGRLVPWKGFDVLIRALPALPSWRLVVIGDGPERARLEAAARDCGVAGRVSFKGALPRAEALGWIASADCFALATSFESFSFQVVEAMALGAAVITTPVGSIPELITDGVEGILLPPDDQEGFARAIESVCDDAASWEWRKAAAREKARAFSTERMVAATVALLDDYA